MQQYKGELQKYVIRGYITAERFDKRIDISNRIVEFSVYESLDKCYLTGEVTFVDDISMTDKFDFRGTERVFIEIFSSDPDSGPVFQREFTCTRIENSTKGSEKASVHLMHLMETHGYDSHAIKFSKSYKGKIEHIVQRIVVGQMRKDLDISYMPVPTVQPTIKAIVPYLNPLHAAQWILQAATSEHGSPFFLYSTIHSDALRLGSLDYMLDQQPFNAKIPYLHSQGATHNNPQDTVQQAFIIHDFSRRSINDNLGMIKAGAVGSTITQTDIASGRQLSRHYSVNKKLQDLKNADIINGEQNVFDPEHLIQDTPSDQISSINYHTLTSTATYDRDNTYHDAHNSQLLNKPLERMSIKNMLYKNQIDISIPGQGLVIAGATVGNLLEADFLQDNAIDADTAQIDNNLSGTYLIYATRHTFASTSHQATVSLCKLEKKQ